MLAQLVLTYVPIRANLQKVTDKLSNEDRSMTSMNSVLRLIEEARGLPMATITEIGGMLEHPGSGYKCLGYLSADGMRLRALLHVKGEYYERAATYYERIRTKGYGNECEGLLTQLFEIEGDTELLADLIKHEFRLRFPLAYMHAREVEDDVSFRIGPHYTAYTDLDVPEISSIVIEHAVGHA